MRKHQAIGIAVAAACMLGPLATGAQVVRESDTNSLAAVLYTPAEPVSWKFQSMGGEILFASLSADIYRPMSEDDSGHETTAVMAEEPGGGGCSGEDSGAGPFKFHIRVLGPDGDVLCMANRPAPPPGWQHDPRLACILPASSVQMIYTVEVGLKANEEHSGDAAVDAEPAPYPFLLDLSLRRIAPNGALVQPALAQSKNRF